MHAYSCTASISAVWLALVPVDALPAWTRPAFAGMRTLNTVQSKLLPAALRSSQNLLLCAPTGAGKTNVAVLAMLSCLAAHRQNAEDDACCRVDLDAFKIVYVAASEDVVEA